MKRISCLAIALLIFTCILASCSQPDQPNQPEQPEHVHNFNEWSVTKNPNCVEAGEKVRYCSCGEKQTEVIPLGNHTEKILPAEEATCTTTGKTEGKKCFVCGETILEQKSVSALEHSYGESYLSDESYHWQKCIRCDDTTEKAEHSYGEDGICICGVEKDIAYSEGLEFTSNGDGTCYVSGIGSCDDTDVVIPPTSPSGDAVTGIGDGAFGVCTSLTSVVIPDSVTSIGDYVFYGCSSLTSIVIPDGVTSIGEWAFFYCVSLKSVIIPDSVTNVGAWAFDECSSLALNEYDNALYLGNEDNPYLALVKVKSTSIESCVIHHETVIIQNGVFYTCGSLTSITVSDENENYKDIDGNLYSVDGKTLVMYAVGKKDTSFAIPDGVTVIGDFAFEGCDSLISIVIPYSVTRIGERAFYACSSLASVVIPDSVTSIGNYAFYNCYSLTSIVIPDSVTTIGKYAFSSCGSLTDVYYAGTEEEWNAISIGSSNYDLTDATIRFNYVPEN